jgi:hypothetical protein
VDENLLRFPIASDLIVRNPGRATRVAVHQVAADFSAAVLRGVFAKLGGKAPLYPVRPVWGNGQRNVFVAQSKLESVSISE